MAKKVSIIVRTYNSEKFAGRAIESALDQTFPKARYEIVVVDDGSTDRTFEALGKFKDSIRVIKNAHQGAIRGINTGIKNAYSPYVILLDSDDVFEKKCAEELYLKIQSDTNARFAYCDYWEHPVRGIKKVVSLKRNIFNSIAGGIMFQKDALLEIGLYDESLVFPEYDVLIKMMNLHRGVYVPKPLFHYMRRPDSVTADRRVVQKGLDQLFEKYAIRYPIRPY